MANTMLRRVQGVIERRLLVNYRVDADVLQRQLPPPFRVDTVGGFGIAGICLIRLAHERLAGCPRWLGLRSENAAHRVAVTWQGPTGPQHGVYILRRDTSSRLNALVGGWIFPGRHHRAAFTVDERARELAVALRSRDGHTRVAVRGRIADRLPASSVFADLEQASRFFERGALGCSPTEAPGRFDRLELRCDEWHMLPFATDQASSSWLDDRARFPEGSAAFDSALCMLTVTHEWRAHPRLEHAAAAATP